MFLIRTFNLAPPPRTLSRHVSTILGHGKFCVSNFTLKTLRLGFCIFPTERGTTQYRQDDDVGHGIELVEISDRSCSGHRNGPPPSYAVSSIFILIQIFLWTQRLKCKPSRCSDDRLCSLSCQVP